MKGIPIKLHVLKAIFVALNLLSSTGCFAVAAESVQDTILPPACAPLLSLSAGKSSEPARRFSGNISWYGNPFNGRKTASGRIFDMNKLTCAHRTLPFGTKVLVQNPHNGKSVIVEVIDRGPYSGGRIMDLSREAARQLGTLLGGITFVNCLVLSSDAVSKAAAPGSETQASK